MLYYRYSGSNRSGEVKSFVWQHYSDCENNGVYNQTSEYTRDVICFLLLFDCHDCKCFHALQARNYISLHTSSRAMYVKREAAMTNRTRDQGNQNPRVPKLNLKRQKKHCQQQLTHTERFMPTDDLQITTNMPTCSPQDELCVTHQSKSL